MCRHGLLSLSLPLVLSLVSCGGGGGGEPQTPPPPPPPPPPASYTIGGTVSGLQGGPVALQLNASTTLTVSANGSFTFGGTVPAGDPYIVIVSQAPVDPAQPCAVTQGSGTATGNVSNVTVTCTGQLIGGTVAGLLGDGLKLSLNGGEGLVTVNDDGAFRFPVTLPVGAPYYISMAVPPDQPVQRCGVASASGTVSSNVSVQVTCSETVHPGALLTFEFGGTPTNLGQPPFTTRPTGRVSSFTAQGNAMGIRAAARAPLVEQMFPRMGAIRDSYPAVMEVAGERYVYSLVITSGTTGNPQFQGIGGVHVSAGARYVSATPGGPYFVAGVAPDCAAGRLAVHPSQRLLFALCSGTSGFSVFSINPQDGSLTRLNAAPLPVGTGAPANFLLHPGGRFLLWLNSREVHSSAIDTSTGELTELSSVSSPGADLAMALSADGTHLYVGTGITGTLKIDPRTGALSRVVGGQSFTDTEDFSSFLGYSRMIQQPGGHVHFYLNGGGQPVGYFKDPQTRLLREVFRNPTAGDVVFDVTGKYVYISRVSAPGRVLRGYAIGLDGAFTPVPDSDTYYPRSERQLIADPSGRSLYIVTDDKRLYQFDIDRSTGMLRRAAHVHSHVPGQTTKVLAIPVTAPIEYQSTSAYVLGDGQIRGLVINEDQQSMGLAPGAAGAVDSDARSIVVDQSNRFVYAANTAAGNISGFNRETDGGLVTMTNGPFSGMNSPLEVVMDPFGDFAWSSDLSRSFVTAHRLDAAADNGVLLRTSGYPVTQPDKLVAHPMLNSFFVASANQNTVVPLSWVPSGTFDNETDNTAFPRPTMGVSPIDMAIEPAGKWLFVLHHTSASISTLRTFYDNAATRGVASVEYIGDGGIANTGPDPRSLAVDPDGGFVYASSFATSSVSVFRIDQLTGRLTEIADSPFPVGGHPSALAVTAGGRMLLVAFPDDGVVAAYGRNLEQGSLTAAPVSTVTTGNAPGRIAITRELLN